MQRRTEVRKAATQYSYATQVDSKVFLLHFTKTKSMVEGYSTGCSGGAQPLYIIMHSNHSISK